MSLLLEIVCASFDVDTMVGTELASRHTVGGFDGDADVLKGASTGVVVVRVSGSASVIVGEFAARTRSFTVIVVDLPVAAHGVDLDTDAAADVNVLDATELERLRPEIGDDTSP